MITRKLQAEIEKRMFSGKAIIVLGARQVGKTTLFKMMLQGTDRHVLMLNCDEPNVQEMLSGMGTPQLKTLIGTNEILMIDEAQRVKDIGMTLKRITDNIPEVQLLVTGSSSLDLQDRLNEPLTGRKFEYNLYPISTGEIMDSSGYLEVVQSLETRLVYGSYPEILCDTQMARLSLMSLSGSYLYKDILSLDSIRRPVLLEKLLKALAYQVSSEVSYNELAQTIGSDSKTVEKYIDLLEKCFVVFRLNGLSRNLRGELKKSKKIYFYDNGIRNAVIQNFAPLSLRQDTGALWENFVISERIKANHYVRRHVNYYFWRTNRQQEIDLVEESDGAFSVFEMKWNSKKARTSFPSSFLAAYNVREKVVVTPENYLDFLL